MKAPLKSIFISALLSLAAFGSVGYLSCNRDHCKTIVCANGGVCNGGSCTCVLGYEGVNCATRSRDKFIGIWTVNEKGSTTPALQYQITIAPGVNVTDVDIKNFYNYFTVPVTASVSGDSLFIYPQYHQAKLLDGIGTIAQTTTYGQFDVMSVQYEVIDSVTQVVNDFGYNFGDGSAPSSWNKED